MKKDPNYLSGYRTFAQVQAALQTLAAQHPQFVHLSQIGISDEGRPQWVLKLSDNAQNDEEEPELMITAATHGDEIITTETTLRFVEELVAGYGTNERITNIIDNNEIFFIPVVNPDGFTKRERYAAGRDPNRDYPWPEKEQRVSVPCIDNLIKFFHSRNIVGSIDFHAFGELVMYPWAYSRQAPDSADQLIFANLANQMSEINAYTAGQISQVIYIAKGSSADYYYWKNNTIATAVELTRSKAPNSDQIPRILDETREMTLRFLENF
ncbi:MAG: M14 family zinc carboxypeptidase [Bdellovibrionota bacterium]